MNIWLIRLISREVIFLARILKTKDRTIPTCCFCVKSLGGLLGTRGATVHITHGTVCTSVFGPRFRSVSVRVLCVKRTTFFLPKLSLYFACQQKLYFTVNNSSITDVLNNITLSFQVNS